MPDEPFEFHIVVGFAGARIPASATLTGTETITVPAGTFECRRVRFAVAGQDVDIWYETAGLRRMVRYTAPVADLVMELAVSTVE